jgi:hypothetical protein
LSVLSVSDEEKKFAKNVTLSSSQERFPPSILPENQKESRDGAAPFGQPDILSIA